MLTNDESNDEYLDRICRIKPKEKTHRKPKKEQNVKIFGYEWEDIKAMQNGTYKRRLVK